jgi:peptidyl-prolyl cis-trans isomerase A (cyclophilin A)
MSAFTFVVPDGVAPGTTLAIPAPDGVKLMIPVAPGIKPGDTVMMAKGADGQWGFAQNAPASGSRVQLSSATTSGQWRSAQQMASDMAAPDSVKVQLQTTKGPINIQVVPKWAPLGAQRFLQMVKDGFYKDISIYRAMQNGLLQFGALQASDPRNSMYSKLPDDPLVGIPYAEGVVGFAASGPNTRKHTVCIMKADFRSQLGKGAHGTTSAETPFGMVCPESMAVMQSITCLGDIPQCGGSGPDPDKIDREGNAYIQREFPRCDFVRSAAIIG